MENCMIIPDMVADLLKSYGVGDMEMEWNLKGQNRGQPITLTMRWRPRKAERDTKRKSPSTIKHEKERTRKYFERKLIEKNMDSDSESEYDNIEYKDKLCKEEDIDNNLMDRERKINEETMRVKEEDVYGDKDSETVKMEPERKRLKQLSRSTDSSSDHSAYSMTDDMHDSDQSPVTDTEWKKEYKKILKVETTTLEESRAKKENLERMLQRTKITPPWLLRKRNAWSRKVQNYS